MAACRQAPIMCEPNVPENSVDPRPGPSSITGSARRAVPARSARPARSGGGRPVTGGSGLVRERLAKIASGKLGGRIRRREPQGFVSSVGQHDAGLVDQEHWPLGRGSPPTAVRAEVAEHPVHDRQATQTCACLLVVFSTFASVESYLAPTSQGPARHVGRVVGTSRPLRSRGGSQPI
jgi:hypothetical protein